MYSLHEDCHLVIHEGRILRLHVEGNGEDQAGRRGYAQKDEYNPQWLLEGLLAARQNLQAAVKPRSVGLQPVAGNQVYLEEGEVLDETVWYIQGIAWEVLFLCQVTGGDTDY